MKTDGQLHLLIGPVGAGKTTYARQEAARSGSVFLDADCWMVRLFGEDPRPAESVMAWYLERRERCRSLLWDTALEVLHSSTDALVELGLVTAAERAHYYQLARDEDVTIHVHLLDAPRELRRTRVLERNQSGKPFTQLVPPEFFERASDLWEPPTEEERKTWDIRDA